MTPDEKIYLLTDGCMWEINKETGNEHPHAVEVVDIETGAVRYIKSGSRIKFIEGDITDIRSQSLYNKKTKEAKKTKEVSSDTENLQDRTRSKTARKNKSQNGVATSL